MLDPNAIIPAAGTNVRGRQDPGRLPAQQVTSHLDTTYDSGVTCSLLLERCLEGIISRTGILAPIQVGNHWIIERTHSWSCGKLRPCTDTSASVDFFLYLAAGLVTIRQLIQRAHYRWNIQPTGRRLK